MGCLLVQDERWLRETFHILPEYLADVEAELGIVTFRYAPASWSLDAINAIKGISSMRSLKTALRWSYRPFCVARLFCACVQSIHIPAMRISNKRLIG